MAQRTSRTIAMAGGAGPVGNPGPDIGPNQNPDAGPGEVAPGGKHWGADNPVVNSPQPMTTNGFRPSDYNQPMPSPGDLGPHQKPRNPGY